MGQQLLTLPVTQLFETARELNAFAPFSRDADRHPGICIHGSALHNVFCQRRRGVLNFGGQAYGLGGGGRCRYGRQKLGQYQECCRRTAVLGTISTDGGGFSGFRSMTEEALGLEGSKLRIDFTGDGQQYKVNLDTGERAQWEADFTTKDGERQSTVLPLEAFKTSIRGTPVVVDDELTFANVEEVGVQLSLVDSAGQPNPEYGDGPFSITVHEIAVEA